MRQIGVLMGARMICSAANGTALSITSSARAEQRQRHYIIAQWLCHFEVYHFDLCRRLLTTARLSSFRLLHTDWMDYGSATKTGI
jgi:hypothetical protein